MNRTPLLFFISLFISSLSLSQTAEHCQLKTYTIETNTQAIATDYYLKNVLIPALKNAGIQNVGVFKPKENEASTKQKMYVLLPFNSLAQFTILNNTYANEINQLNRNVNYIDPSKTKSPYQKIESVLIKAYVTLPSGESETQTANKKDRVYELISVEATAEDLMKEKKELYETVQKTKLFDESSFNEIFYGEVLADNSDANLMYMTSYMEKEATPEQQTAVTNYSRKTKRKMRRDRRRKMREEKKNPVVKIKMELPEKKSPNSITNLLFATDYSDF